jgi:transcriptional regulator
MYLPEHFHDTDAEAIDALIGGARLGALITHDAEGLYASHLPILWDAKGRVASGHLARANPHRARAGNGEALIIVTGADAYVSPSFYPSKAEDPRHVPTWNYEAVHLYGRLEWFDDADRLRAVLVGLTQRHEAGRDEPWAIGDAPADYIERMLRGIVGVTLQVERIEAKRKLSQNRDARDRSGVATALTISSDPRDREAAAAMVRVDKPG